MNGNVNVLGDYMKSKTITTVLLLSFVLGSVAYLVGQDLKQRSAGISADQAAQANIIPHKVIAYYFHSDVRCPSCLKIEKYSREAIETKFAGALEDGILEWKLVNTDKPENSHFIGDYQLFTKSLVIVDFVEGKQVQWKNLEKVWDLLGDKDAFTKYVQNEVKAYLEGA